MICLVSLLPLSSLASEAGVLSGFVGAETCKTCHQTQYKAWSKSDHHGAMQTADERSVLGDFSNVTVNFHGTETRFFKQDGDYLVETMGPESKSQIYVIKYTFGVDPLQQYLIELEDGHIQAFNIAWDTRLSSKGGQRWFHLRPNEDMSPSHLFFWSRHFQNWNNRCSECHSTNVELNYSEADHRYRTTFSEENVACEACHGPAQDHVALARAGELSKSHSGFSRVMPGQLEWVFEEGKPIAVAKGVRDDKFLESCGRCHSLRTRLTDNTAGPFHENYALQLINEPNYFADGQIQEEVFVLGSFLQSKMYQAGVTCNDCHEPHSLQLIKEGNELCAQCHRPEVFDRAAHHGVEELTGAPTCVDCHMPDRTYMQVDDRRDHSFWVPGRSAIGERNLEELAPILKASVLAEMTSRPSPEALLTIQSYLKDEDPLIRRGAVMGAARLPPRLRWQLLNPLINDSSRLVRYAVADALVDLLSPLLGQLPDEARNGLLTLVNEYEQTLQLNRDSPAGQLSLARLALQRGKPEVAKAAFERAFTIEPDFEPTLLNFADYYRSTGQDPKGAVLLERALRIAPDSALANHSYGLYLVRQRQYVQSLPYLKSAVRLDGNNAYFANVFAVALESQGQPAAAIETLVEASKRIPDDFDLLYTLVLYCQKHGRENEVKPYVERLKALAPESVEVQRLWQKYQRR
jgi:predicted CXXCH cytochrome family protein